MNKLEKYIFNEVSAIGHRHLKLVFSEAYSLNESARIQHAEDFIFWEGSAGAKRVLTSFLELQKDGYKNLTIKWDGSPAVIFGRNQSGQFVLTDKSGFTAKSYNGKVTSPEELEQMFLNRGKNSEKSDEYRAFANNMKSVFNVFESAIPKSFRGYFKGDLLYFSKPPIENGKYIFKPNLVTYHVDVNSELGKKIDNSISGVVIHRMVDELGNETPIENFGIFQGTKLLVIPPISIQNAPKINVSKLKETVSLLNANSSNIDKMLNESTLTTLKLSDFPDNLYRYINSKVDTGLDKLGADFKQWLESPSNKLTDTKKAKTWEYIEKNRAAFDVLWKVVTNIMDIKDDIIKQIDAQDLPIKAFIGNQSGGEGYVLSDPAGDIKFVSRSSFSAANRAIRRENVNEGGWLKPELTSKTKITPQIVNKVFENAKKFIKDFNQYLSNNNQKLITDFKILGSAKYFQADLDDKKESQYGDIDVMFVLPEFDDIDDSKVKTMYSKFIVDFVKTANQDYIDVESAERSAGKQLVLKIDTDQWVQIDLLYTFKKYSDWFSSRFSPERGLKGFVIGYLYSSLADTLRISIADRGVRAKIKDNQIVNPLLRKDVVDNLISTNPRTFLFDIFVFLAKLFNVKYHKRDIDNNLTQFSGIDPDNIKFESLAYGVLGLSKTLDNTGILLKMNMDYQTFVDKIKTTYKAKNQESLTMRSKKADDEETTKNLEKIEKDAKIGISVVDRILKEFVEDFKKVVNEGGNAVNSNSKIPREYLESTVKNGLKIYKLNNLDVSIIGNTSKSVLGDIDVATPVEGLEQLLKASYEIDKKDFYVKLEEYISKNIPPNIPKPEYKMMSGLDQVSINVPIVDKTNNHMMSTDTLNEKGYVQLDLMIGDVTFMKKALSGAPEDSKYKAAMRNLLLMNIMRYSYEPTSDPNTRVRYQFNWKKGLQKLDVVKNAKGKEEKKNIKTIYTDMDDVAVFLFGSNHTFNDISSFEKLFKLLSSNDFKYKQYKDEIIADFKEEIKKLGFEI